MTLKPVKKEMFLRLRPNTPATEQVYRNQVRKKDIPDLSSIIVAPPVMNSLFEFRSNEYNIRNF